MGERVIKDKFNIHETYRKMNIINPYRYSGGGGGNVSQEFIDNAGLTDPAHISAVQQLETDLKNNNLWDKMSAIYPFVGGNANAHKYNLKDPRDLDAAFRITYSGSPTHSSGGVSTVSSSYLNTNLKPNEALPATNGHLSLYSITNNTPSGSDTVDMGSMLNTGSAFILLIRGQTGKNTLGTRNAAGLVSIANSDAKGFYVSSKIDNTNTILLKNGALKSSGASGGTQPSSFVFIGAMQLNAVTYGNVNQTYAFASVGTGLTEAESITFNTIVQDYQTNLGRNV